MGEKLFVKFDDCKILAINLNRKKEINCHFRFVIFYLREKEKKKLPLFLYFPVFPFCTYFRHVHLSVIVALRKLGMHQSQLSSF